MANNLLEQDKIDEIDKIFRSLDTEFNGKLSIKQIYEMNILDTKNTFEQDAIKEVLNAADLDGTGSIDVAEFRGSAMLINSNFSDVDIRTTFNFFDRDNCGHLTVSDIFQSVNVINADHKEKNHVHAKTSLKMQELEDKGIKVDEFIKIIRDYEHKVSEVWEQFEQLRKKSHNA